MKIATLLFFVLLTTIFDSFGQQVDWSKTKYKESHYKNWTKVFSPYDSLLVATDEEYRKDYFKIYSSFQMVGCIINCTFYISGQGTIDTVFVNRSNTTETVNAVIRKWIKKTEKYWTPAFQDGVYKNGHRFSITIYIEPPHCERSIFCQLTQKLHKTAYEIERDMFSIHPLRPDEIPAAKYIDTWRGYSLPPCFIPAPKL